jgi:hypothetical protein
MTPGNVLRETIMKRSIFFIAAAVLVCFCAMTSQAQAQATRTWVSGVGDDANPCSRTAPCKTFAGAISKTTDCGEIDVLDPGGFGTLTITKGIKIDGGGGEAGQVASILAAGNVNGLTINNTSATCLVDVIRNLDINGIAPISSGGGAIGINFVAGKNVAIENVDIENFNQQCINIQPASSMNLIMHDSNLENCILGGIKSSTTTGTNRINIEKSTISRSQIGVQATSNSDIVIHASMVSNNGSGGVESSGSTSLISVDLSTVSNNQVFGVHATNSGVMRVTNTSIYFNNGTGMLTDPGSQMLTGNNNWLGGNATSDGTKTGSVTIL